MNDKPKTEQSTEMSFEDFSDILDILDMFYDEQKKWNFFSDSQGIWQDETEHFHACMCNYYRLVTIKPITTAKEAIQALFRLMWLCYFPDFIDSDDIWEED